ncbi:MAG TPA: polyphosphate kinase 2 family protein [candidate division Zixibacteria bacterium]|nr:polyphosphate kinase 2 family protein [candidate division Zixibacteria bacterium]
MAKKISDLVDKYRVANGKRFRLKDYNPGDTYGLGTEFKGISSKFLEASAKEMAELQDKLYAQDRWSLLIILQAMDAAGKDGTIKHVMSGINPQGCRVISFKSPSNAELDHDYMWRCLRELPSRGNIGIFNRSYYEEVLAVRVHPEFLQAEHLPDKLVGKNLWRERFEDINAIERYLTRNGTVILKFFLHLSKREQKKRFLSRLDEPVKNWKFSAADVHEREFWDQYQEAFEDMIRHTASSEAPWHVVPADNKWFTRLVVASTVVEALKGLKLEYPTVDAKKKKALEEARVKLEAENNRKK